MNLHTQEKIIKNKLGLLNLAQELGSVSRACKVFGYSRASFYRFTESYSTSDHSVAPPDADNWSLLADNKRGVASAGITIQFKKKLPCGNFSERPEHLRLQLHCV